jgi:D-tyrosyl-tRNA(Tyr) deacylase
MKILIQRVLHASVQVCEETVGAIGAGALVFVGVTHGDTSKQVNWLVNKLVNLRIFEDSEGKMNKSLLDQKGEALIISQFTLYGDCSSGRRPSFSSAANPDLAQQLYEQFIAEVKAAGVIVQTGLFGAEMKVSLLNDGPVTFMIESF